MFAFILSTIAEQLFIWSFGKINAITGDVYISCLLYTSGHSKSYIQSISSGKALPSMAEFLYICSYLDVSPKEFFDEDINHPVKSHELNELIKDMSSDDLELLISLTRRIKDL